MKLQEYLKQNILLTDGATGTYYNEKYPESNLIVEQANLIHPEQIVELQLQYLRAGSRLLRTNSFAANSKFFPEQDLRLQTVRKSYQIAKKAVCKYREESGSEEDIYIAADLGTVFDGEIIGSERVLEEYRENIDVFLQEGADVFLFETQADTSLLQELASYIKLKRPDAFVAATFSLDKTGYTKAGIGLLRLSKQIHNIPELDAYGLNCGMDALHMLSHVKQLHFYDNRPVFTVPNSGYPYMLRGRPIYAKNESYFVEHVKHMIHAGVNVVGGCCGTTPNHIRKLHEAILGEAPVEKFISEYVPGEEHRTMSSFWKKLKTGEKPFIVELDPPFDTDIDKVMSGSKTLKEYDVDLLTLSDSPMGRTRMDSLQLAGKIQREVGIQVMPHMTCRDRNLIALRGNMLGSYMNDIRHYLIVTGDPVPVQDRSTVTAVFDYNSIHFMHLIREMNQELFVKDTVVYGGALNYHGKNPDPIVKRMKQKMEEGCAYFLTQPVYSEEDIERLRYLKKETNAKICCGIMPLVSYRNATFIANEMPGIRVPAEVVDAYDINMTREEAEEVAVRLSLDVAKRMQDVADGYYFMTPFNRVSLICKIIDRIREEL